MIAWQNDPPNESGPAPRGHAEPIPAVEKQARARHRGAVYVPLGRVLATPGALRALALARVDGAAYLARHAVGDWGDVDVEDRAANDRALSAGERLLSAYRLPNDARLWILTEADRSATTLLLPTEY
jgi:hypothetical protein